MRTVTVATDVTETLTNGIAYIILTRGKTYLRHLYALVNRRVLQGEKNSVYTDFLYWSQIYLSI